MDNSMETSFIVADNILKGKIYRFRFRSLNINGWSDYSPVSYIRAATLPERPPAPTFGTATNNLITINLFQSSNAGGSEILYYELYRNKGGVTTN